MPSDSSLPASPGSLGVPARGTWRRVIGQQRVKEILLSAFTAHRLPHAYLFFGTDGVGKDAMALEFARVLHCERSATEACDQCPSCLKMSTMQHPDVHFVVALPVGKNEENDDGPLDKLTSAEIASLRSELSTKAGDPYYRITMPRANFIKINSIRDIRRTASLTTSDQRKRVFIVSRADMMNDQAANTLLKTLEEPSGNTMFILTTSQRESLPQTILSRCQQVRFDPLTEVEIQEALVARKNVPSAHAALVARLAHGSYTRAVALLDTDLAQEREDVVTFLLNVVLGRHDAVLDAIEELSRGKDRERVTRFLLLMLLWFRDALSLQHGGKIINIDLEERLTRFVSKYRESDLHQILAEIEKAISLVERFVYIKLVLLQLVVELKANIREVS